MVLIGGVDSFPPFRIGEDRPVPGTAIHIDNEVCVSQLRQMVVVKRHPNPVDRLGWDARYRYSLFPFGDGLGQVGKRKRVMCGEKFEDGAPSRIGEYRF